MQYTITAVSAHLPLAVQCHGMPPILQFPGILMGSSDTPKDPIILVSKYKTKRWPGSLGLFQQRRPIPPDQVESVRGRRVRHSNVSQWRWREFGNTIFGTRALRTPRHCTTSKNGCNVGPPHPLVNCRTALPSKLWHLATTAF